jgi:hypothetical protein
VEDFTGGQDGQRLRRGGQPVHEAHAGGRGASGRVDAQPGGEERSGGGHLGAGRQTGGRRHARREEDLDALAEVVVGGDLVVEAEHLRPLTQQRGGMRPPAQQRADGRGVEPAAQQDP